jgi:hypothetical protein
MPTLLNAVIRLELPLTFEAIYRNKIRHRCPPSSLRVLGCCSWAITLMVLPPKSPKLLNRL